MEEQNFDAWFAEELALEAAGVLSIGQIKAFIADAVKVPCRKKYRAA
jgi:hypothetical protein